MLYRMMATACFALLASGTAQAAIIDVTGPNSTLGTAPAIIGAPANALDNDVTNTGMQGFNEAQGVVTSMDYQHDFGTILMGTLVDSHMIFLNSEGSALLTHRLVEWTFDGTILGVMSDINGAFEAASSAELGADGTNYPALGFANRGLEPAPADSYTVAGNVLTVSMNVTEPGDWIRVVTSATVIPLPASLPLSLFGLAALGWVARRRGRRAA